MGQYRNYCFTLNNPLENGGLDICDWLEENTTYAIIGCEVGDQGTFHWQGYFELARAIRMTTLLKLKFKWHLEARRGSQKQANDYCMKDANFVTFGVMKEQGARADLDEVRQEALDGGMRAVTRHRNCQQIRVAEKFLTYNDTHREWETNVIYIHGPSGIGKSRLAREIVDKHGYKDDCYVKNTATRFWDGYDGHKAVIIDDFRDSWWPMDYTLGLLDRYAFQVEVKGGSRAFKPFLIVITCTRPPHWHYRNSGECLIQFSRRISEVIDLTPACDTSSVTEVGGNTMDPPLLM